MSKFFYLIMAQYNCEVIHDNSHSPLYNDPQLLAVLDVIYFFFLGGGGVKS